VTDQEFKSALYGFKYYLKPALFTVLSENADAFSEETKKDILEKLQEADSQMHRLYEYQEKRNGIMRKGIEKIQDIYTKAKASFQASVLGQHQTEMTAADELISNL